MFYKNSAGKASRGLVTTSMTHSLTCLGIKVTLCFSLGEVQCFNNHNKLNITHVHIHYSACE